MRYQRRQKNQIDGLITLVLFGVFAVCILSVLLTGARVYHDLTNGGQKAYDQRTCTQFIATKVRQAQSGDAVSVSKDIICITEEINGETYITRIYCYDGWLREMFTSEKTEFSPENGEKIIEAECMKSQLTDGMLAVDITDAEGKEMHLTLSLRGKGAEQ